MKQKPTKKAPKSVGARLVDSVRELAEGLESGEPLERRFTVRVVSAAPGGVDANGWPRDFFARVAGSMPELERAPQGQFEDRPSLE